MIDVVVADGAVVGISPRWTWIDVELDGVESTGFEGFRRFDPALRCVLLAFVAIVVETDAISKLSPEQLPDGTTKILARDVPECHLDPTDGAHDGPLVEARCRNGVHHVGEEVVDVPGVLSEKASGQALIHDDLLDARTVVGLANPHEAGVRAHLDEHPGERSEEVGADVSDLHWEFKNFEL